MDCVGYLDCKGKEHVNTCQRDVAIGHFASSDKIRYQFPVGEDKQLVVNLHVIPHSNIVSLKSEIESDTAAGVTTINHES